MHEEPLDSAGAVHPLPPTTPVAACETVRQSAAELKDVTTQCDESGETSPGSAFSVLSVRQREVVGLLADGLSSKEVATRLNVSVKTIESHRAAALQKLRVTGVANLTKYAIREGLTAL